MFSEFSKIEWI